MRFHAPMRNEKDGFRKKVRQTAGENWIFLADRNTRRLLDTGGFG